MLGPRNARGREKFQQCANARWFQSISADYSPRRLKFSKVCNYSKNASLEWPRAGLFTTLAASLLSSERNESFNLTTTHLKKGDITTHLKKGDRIRIAGLGILQVRKRPARMGRNPATGEPIKIKAGKKVAFRAAKDLKEEI